MKLDEVNVGQPEFFKAVARMARERPIADWQLYLRWHVLRDAAPRLPDALRTPSGNVELAPEPMVHDVPRLRVAMDRRTNGRLAWYLVFYEIEGVGQRFPEQYRKAVEAVTAADLLRVARTYLANPTTVVLRPR